MKVRVGFVSNSSSSSFIILAPQDIDFDCERCNELYKKVQGNLGDKYDTVDEYVKVEYGDNWEEFMDSYGSTPILDKARENNLAIYHNNIEYGDDEAFERLLKLFKLEYEVS